mgnify:CR=1 FL=1
MLQRDWLGGHTQGLVALSGGMDGEIARLLLAGRSQRVLLMAVAAAALNAALNLVLIARLGMGGAALAVIGTALISVTS